MLQTADLCFWPRLVPAVPSFADYITPSQLGCEWGRPLVPLQLYLQLLGTGADTPAERMQQGTLYADVKTSLLANTAAWLEKETAAAHASRLRTTPPSSPTRARLALLIHGRHLGHAHLQDQE